jgi:hypothetical protein
MAKITIPKPAAADEIKNRISQAWDTLGLQNLAMRELRRHGVTEVESVDGTGPVDITDVDTNKLPQEGIGFWVILELLVEEAKERGVPADQMVYEMAQTLNQLLHPTSELVTHPDFEEMGERYDEVYERLFSTKESP